MACGTGFEEVRAMSDVGLQSLGREEFIVRVRYPHRGQWQRGDYPHDVPPAGASIHKIPWGPRSRRVVVDEHSRQSTFHVDSNPHAARVHRGESLKVG